MVSILDMTAAQEGRRVAGIHHGRTASTGQNPGLHFHNLMPNPNVVPKRCPEILPHFQTGPCLGLRKGRQVQIPGLDVGRI